MKKKKIEMKKLIYEVGKNLININELNYQNDWKTLYS